MLAGEPTRLYIGVVLMNRKHFTLIALTMGFAIMNPVSAQNSTAPRTPPSQSTAPQTGIQIPEPGDFALFMIGVAGLVIGRWTSKARKRKQE
jgi:hypothetical protein